VKTSLKRGGEFRQVVDKLADEAQKIREASLGQALCWAGLFVYDDFAVLMMNTFSKHSRRFRPKNKLAPSIAFRLARIYFPVLGGWPSGYNTQAQGRVAFVYALFTSSVLLHR